MKNIQVRRWRYDSENFVTALIKDDDFNLAIITTDSVSIKSKQHIALASTIIESFDSLNEALAFKEETEQAYEKSGKSYKVSVAATAKVDKTLTVNCTEGSPIAVMTLNAATKRTKKLNSEEEAIKYACFGYNDLTDFVPVRIENGHIIISKIVTADNEPHTDYDMELHMRYGLVLKIREFHYKMEVSNECK